MNQLQASAMGAPKTKESKINIRISPDELSALDELRKAESDLPGRSEMIRRLIKRAEEAAKAKKAN